jgi:hypothetical protein
MVLEPKPKNFTEKLKIEVRALKNSSVRLHLFTTRGFGLK